MSLTLHTSALLHPPFILLMVWNSCDHQPKNVLSKPANTPPDKLPTTDTYFWVGFLFVNCTFLWCLPSPFDRSTNCREHPLSQKHIRLTQVFRHGSDVFDDHQTIFCSPRSPKPFQNSVNSRGSNLGWISLAVLKQNILKHFWVSHPLWFTGIAWKIRSCLSAPIQAPIVQGLFYNTPNQCNVLSDFSLNVTIEFPWSWILTNRWGCLFSPPA